MVKKIIKNEIKSKLLSPTYEEQKYKKVMVERSGFIPRAILVQKMAVQGELNKIINDYENNKLFGRTDDTNKRIGLLNIKGLTRSELIRLARNRYEDIKGIFFNDLDNMSKQQAVLQSKVDIYTNKGTDVPGADIPSDNN